jgi:hypothetical protein
MNSIKLLKELDHENLVKMLEANVSPEEKTIYLVLEYAEYDLSVCNALKYIITQLCYRRLFVTTTKPQKN